MQSWCDKAGLCRDAQLVLHKLVWLSDVRAHVRTAACPGKSALLRHVLKSASKSHLPPSALQRHLLWISFLRILASASTGWLQCTRRFSYGRWDSVGFIVAMFSSYPGRRDVASWKSTFWRQCEQQRVRWFELRDSPVLVSSRAWRDV